MATVNGFVDRKAELEFILTKMEGPTRGDMLGVKRVMYVSRGAADNWLSWLLYELGREGCSTEAVEQAKKIHSRLTGQA